MEEKMSLRDLAEKLNVSTSTISRVINDKPGVGDKTRQRVIEALQIYNITSNSSARSLKTSKTGNIALISKRREDKYITSDHHHPFGPFIESELRKYGYHTIAMSLGDEEMENAGKLLMIKENRVDGFIINGPSIPAKFIMALKNTGLPVVLFGNQMTQVDIDSIVYHDRSGAYKATKHLIEHGHKNILFLSGPRGWYTCDERKTGYTEALIESGLQERITYMTDTTIESGKTFFKESIENVYPEITAVICTNDATAIGVLDEVRCLGLKVPDDIAVIGFDDIPWASLSYPPLTTIHVFIEEMGKITVNRIIDLLKNPELHPITTFAATELVIRKSCGC